MTDDHVNSGTDGARVTGDVVNGTVEDQELGSGASIL